MPTAKKILNSMPKRRHTLLYLKNINFIPDVKMSNGTLFFVTFVCGIAETAKRTTMLYK